MTAARSDLMALKPCPFCGGNDLTLTVNRHGWKIVECDNCGMRGPCIDLEGDEYLNRWNTRAQPDREAIKQAITENIDYGYERADHLSQRIFGFEEATDAILSPLSGAGTKSDGRTRDSLSSQENEPVVTRACGPSDPSPGPDVREALETIASNDGNADQAVAKRALELIDNLSALTRPLGGFVQGSIARKQSTDTEGSSRTETAGGEG